MKIIGTVVLVLTAGISSFTYAESPVDVFMKALCTKNGKLKTYEDRKIHKAMLHACVAPVTNELTQILSKNYDELDIVIAAYCDKREDLYNCYKSSSEIAGESCFVEPGQHNDMETRLNVAASMLRFPCENRMLTKAALRSPYMPKCVNNFRTVVANCLSKAFLGPNITIRNLIPMDEINPNKSSLDIQTCSKIQKVEECSVEALGIRHNCIDDVFATMLDSLLKYINNDIPCGNLPRTPKSDTPNSVVVTSTEVRSNSEGLSGSVVNVLLLSYAVIAVTF